MMHVINNDSRQRMIQSAALLFREQGYSGTGFRDVIEHSGAPRGSIYHHFPGGKAQLAEETMAWAGAVVARRIERAVAGGDPLAVVKLFVDFWRDTLQDTDFRAGCPVVAVAIEADAGSRPLDAVSAAFATWQDLVAESLRIAGVGKADSRRLATLTIAAIEGAIVLCRAHRDLRPLNDVRHTLESTLKAALPTD